MPFIGNTRLLVEEVPKPSWRGKQEWDLRRELVYQDEKGEIHRVPVGYRTDYASVPRILWPIYPPTGRYNKAAVLHDFYCSTGLISRKEADALFLEAMKSLHVLPIASYPMYGAVRAYGFLFKDNIVFKEKRTKGAGRKWWDDITATNEESIEAWG